MSEGVWLEGYYSPVMENFEDWQTEWSMGPHAEPDWVWFNGDQYTEEQARAHIKVGKVKNG